MLDLGTEGNILMEIVAFDEDDKADGTGKAGITWISKYLLNSNHNMNSTTTSAGGWTASELRSYLKETIKPLIPAAIRSGIVEVSKVQTDYTEGVKSIQSSTEDVWVPNVREVTTSTYYETTGADYGSRFADSNSCLKKKPNAGSASIWWLRSVGSSKNFAYIGSKGSISSSYSPASTLSIALGFCTN